MSRATCRGTRTRGVGEVVDDEPMRGGVVDDEQRHEPRDEPRDVPRHPVARRRQSSRRQAMSRVTCRAMCQGTRMHGRGEVVDDEPARSGVVDDEPARGGVVYDERCNEPRDELRDVPRHPVTRRRRSNQRRACARRTSRRRAARRAACLATRRAEAPGRAAEAE
jgi:hypothetical protein